MENHLGKPYALVLMIGVFSIIAILIQKKIDTNHKNKVLNYQNLDVLKYFCAILIVILHLRPFLNYSNQLDLAFNNIISRMCVPMFFVITGYFVGKKENDEKNYIKNYIKKMLPLYLIWSAMYLPITFGTLVFDWPIITNFLSLIDVPIQLSIPIIVILSPLIILIALIYTGIYYHLWYFPALLLSLVILDKWKKRFTVKKLLIISFFLLLFGATETYYGILPNGIQQALKFYYNVFFTTRNCLFFGLFYVVLGYSIGTETEVYAKYCFEKLVISLLLLIFEAIVLHDIERLNSNILLSCIPVCYYLFITTIYFTDVISKNFKFPFRDLSKYYYFIHPAIIAICTWIFNYANIDKGPYFNILLVLLITHILSMNIILLKKKYKKLMV